jgi:hypothetical protein
MLIPNPAFWLILGLERILFRYQHGSSGFQILVLTSLSNHQTTPGSCSMKNCVLLGKPVEEKHAKHTLSTLRDCVAIRSEPFDELRANG